MSKNRVRRLREAAALLVACAVVLAAASCSSGGSGGSGAGGAGGSEADGSGSGDRDGASEADGSGSGDRDGASEPVRLPDGYGGYHSDLYADDANWLCKPDLDDDICHRDLDATVVDADGSTEVERHHPAEDPAVDCFYVYPTTSADPGPNSDLHPGESEEISTVYNQAARFTESCRVFAPLYRQATLSSIGGGAATGVANDPWSTAYVDVLDAFKDYVANESNGRPFVLIGHSQGAGLLNRLVKDEIDGEPLLRDRLVSAMLIGWPVSVPEGEAVGGDFAHVPLCESADQTGCVVNYSSFRSTAPPPPGALFGRSASPGRQAGCTNPASLGGGSASLHPYFAVRQSDGALLGAGSAQPFADPSRTSEITTPFVTYPDLVSAECVHDGDYTYLSLTVHGDPDDPRTDDIGGDLTPQWGMHLVDINVAIGDLVALVASEAEAYTAGSAGD
jgi:hypothetical protein